MHSTIAEEYRAITPGLCVSVAYWEAEEGFVLECGAIHSGRYRCCPPRPKT